MGKKDEKRELRKKGEEFLKKSNAAPYDNSKVNKSFIRKISKKEKSKTELEIEGKEFLQKLRAAPYNKDIVGQSFIKKIYKNKDKPTEPKKHNSLFKLLKNIPEFYIDIYYLFSFPFPWLLNFIEKTNWFSPLRLIQLIYYLWGGFVFMIFFFIPIMVLFIFGYLFILTTDWIGLTNLSPHSYPTFR